MLMKEMLSNEQATKVILTASCKILSSNGLLWRKRNRQKDDEYDSEALRGEAKKDLLTLRRWFWTTQILNDELHCFW